MDFPDNTPQANDDETPDVPDLNAFDALENLNAFSASVPEGDYITLRLEANPPMYVAFAEGETTLSLAAAIERRGLLVSNSIHAYLDSAQIDMNFMLAPGSMVTLVGNVKGG